MDSTAHSSKARVTNMVVTRLAAKEATRVIEQKGSPTKRKRRRENDTPTAATNGSKYHTEDRETDEDESPPKFSKVSEEGEETNDSEEDMEVKEDGEDDEDSDQDQDTIEDMDEEDCHVQDRQVKTSSGEPLAVDRTVLRTSVDISNCSRSNPLSRPSIRSENQGKKGTTDSLPGTGFHSRANQTEAFPPRAGLTQAFAPRAGFTRYREETVLDKPRPASQTRCPPAWVPIPSRPVMRKVPNSVSLHKPTATVERRELAAKSTVKTSSHSFFGGWIWKVLLLVLISLGAFLPYLFIRKRAPASEAVAGEGFQARFLDVASDFPSQRAALWKRSKIHLERHLQTATPTEPVSMILTSGRGAERTLRCLASRMAAAFSSALGASAALHIDGARMAALESDQVKLDIDEQLSAAFEGDGRAAVVHRFEELPPGSTLIFYRFCDHENAAYKKVLLVFTVLLPEEALGPQLALNAVEEMVQGHIQNKFLSPSQSAAYDKMDLDKLSGLWSRISHLVLPVALEEHIEQQGCEV